MVVSGNIELTEVNIAFKTAGRLIERTVDEGDAVKKGQVIARLDRDQLLAQREREAAATGVGANRNWRRRRPRCEWQKANLAADIETAQGGPGVQRGAPGGAEERLAAAGEAGRPGGGGRGASGTGARQAGLGARADAVSRTTTSRPRNTTSTATASRAPQAALKQAQEREALVLAGPRVEADRTRSRRRWSGRAAALKMAEANALEMKRREQELATRRAEIERSKASLALIDSQLADTVAASPVDGVVLVKAADVGEVLAPGTTVVTVGDIDHPWLRGYVNETDLGKVKIGSQGAR